MAKRNQHKVDNNKEPRWTQTEIQRMLAYVTIHRSMADGRLTWGILQGKVNMWGQLALGRGPNSAWTKWYKLVHRFEAARVTRMTHNGSHPANQAMKITLRHAQAQKPTGGTTIDVEHWANLCGIAPDHAQQQLEKFYFPEPALGAQCP